ncbi:MAG: sulfite exporter TauE/SafE family protein [Oscillospiraceae bacterium]|nr:sulfite exporter TauE/SafE family protein [Oscillospiraceae bacterium]
MDNFFGICITVCPLVFLAGFVDSVAGGGGVISLPAYLMAGLPVHTAAGTNKLVNGSGTLIAAIKYFKSGKVDLTTAAIAAATALIGSTIGTEIAVFLPDRLLKLLFLFTLPLVAVFLAVKKDFGQDGGEKESKLPKKMKYRISACIGLAIGMYDGIIGPGTGTFLIMAFSGLLRMDLLKSSGCAKVVNLASNVAAAIVWIFNGAIFWPLAAFATVCSIAGNYCGALYAIRGGSRRVRGMMFVVLGLLFVKLLTELLR